MKKTNKTPNTLLRKYRKEQFETLEAFCEVFEKKHKEKLAVGTLSYYETGGGISSRRLNLITEVLKLSDYKKEKVKQMWNDELQYRELYKEREVRKARSKRKTKGEATTITIKPEPKKRVAHTIPGVRKETSKKKTLIKQLRIKIAAREREIAKQEQQINIYKKAITVLS